MTQNKSLYICIKYGPHAAMLHTCDGAFKRCCNASKSHAMFCDRKFNMLNILLPILECLSRCIFAKPQVLTTFAVGSRPGVHFAGTDQRILHFAGTDQRIVHFAGTDQRIVHFAGTDQRIVHFAGTDQRIVHFAGTDQRMSKRRGRYLDDLSGA